MAQGRRCLGLLCRRVPHRGVRKHFRTWIRISWPKILLVWVATWESAANKDLA